MSGWLRSLFPARPKASPEQAWQLLDQGAILVDVREDAEWRAGHAPGARHIPLSRLPARPFRRDARLGAGRAARRRLRRAPRPGPVTKWP
jgi:3-mercaptopyruvate sulfurtransferase SseA